MQRSARPASPLVDAALGRAYLYRYNLTRDKAWAEKAAEAAQTEAKLEEALAAHKTDADKLEDQPKEKASGKGPTTDQNKENKKSKDETSE